MPNTAHVIVIDPEGHSNTDKNKKVTTAENTLCKDSYTYVTEIIISIMMLRQKGGGTIYIK